MSIKLYYPIERTVGFYDSILHVYVPFEVDLFLYVISILLLTQSYHHTKI